MNTQIFILFFFIFFILTSSSPNCNEDPEFENGATTLKVYHISSPCSTFHNNPSSLSWEQSVLQLQAKDQARVLYLSSLVAKKSVVPIASGRQVIQSPTYVLRAKIGTPAQTMMVALDTSNDAAWFPCKGCVGCSSSSSSSSVFDSSASSSFMAVACQAPACKQVPNPTCGGGACVFNMTYGGSSLSANLSTDTITLAADSVPGYTFGCIQKATGSSIPPQGLLGLGRGPLSFLSQTQSLYQSTFSYCLPSFKSGNFSGSLKLGPVGQPKKIKFTPLLKNPRRSSLYYVNLNGVRVGKKVVEIPASALAFDAATGAGTIIDSANPIFFNRHGVHEASDPSLHGSPRRVPEARGSKRHRDVTRRFRHMLLDPDRGPHDHAPLRRDERDPAGGQHPDPQHRREHVVPGHGGGAGQRQLGGQRHSQHAAAEPPRLLRRGQLEGRRVT
ncbi:Aspartyl protease AED3 [Linum perenne]